MSIISVIIPAWNEQGGIVKTIEAIPKNALESAGHKVQILVIDGGSTDGTAELATKAGAEVIIERKRGYGLAYKTGFSKAKGDIIVTADADGTYPVEDIPSLVRTLESENLDFITTDRFKNMENGVMSFRNKAGNMVLAWETKLLFGLKIKDPESGMWVFKRNILPRLKLTTNDCAFSHEIKIEACYFARCRWKEVPITYKSRDSDEGKLTSGWTGWKTGLIDLSDIFRKRAVGGRVRVKIGPA